MRILKRYILQLFAHKLAHKKGEPGRVGRLFCLVVEVFTEPKAFSKGFRI